ncbi:MAG: hypothetical protein L6R37_005422 [Teloschistes peruensis]|nr:MAG: hypothetical protein L6R37_005422 [Teloschistes peruensis]
MKTSAKRRARLQEIEQDSTMHDESPALNPFYTEKQAFRAASKAIKLLKKEIIRTLALTLRYRDAANISARMGKLKAACLWQERAIEHTAVCCGKDSPDYEDDEKEYQVYIPINTIHHLSKKSTTSPITSPANPQLQQPPPLIMAIHCRPPNLPNEDSHYKPTTPKSHAAPPSQPNKTSILTELLYHLFGVTCAILTLIILTYAIPEYYRLLASILTTAFWILNLTTTLIHLCIRGMRWTLLLLRFVTRALGWALVISWFFTKAACWMGLVMGIWLLCFRF